MLVSEGEILTRVRISPTPQLTAGTKQSMKINLKQKVTELTEILGHIAHFVALIKKGNATYVKPLSVELRKLYCKGAGNNLIIRIEEETGIKIKFPIRIKEPHIPPTYRDGSVDEYIDEFRFFQAGKRYTRRDIIHLVADKKGAHLDDKEEPFHGFEKTTILPVGNPSREGVYPLGTKYLIDIAQTSLVVLQAYSEELEIQSSHLLKDSN